MREQNKYYVSMKDTFMSGWGHAEGKDNILIFECDSLEQAEIVADNARNSTDQANIRIRTKPMHSTAQCYIQDQDINDCPAWYEKDYY